MWTTRSLFVAGLVLLMCLEAGAFSAEIVRPADQAVFELGESVEFEASCSQCDWEVTFEWDGLGYPQSGPYVVAAFVSPGVKTVTLTATCWDTPPAVVTDTVQVRIIGGQPRHSPTNPFGRAHYHGTSPEEQDHVESFEPAPGQPAGTTYAWTATVCLTVKSVSGEGNRYAHVKGIDVSRAIDDSEVRCRYTLGGKTTQWYSLATFAGIPVAVLKPSNPPNYINPYFFRDGNGWGTTYGFDLQDQFGSEFLCYVHEWIDPWEHHEPDWVNPNPPPPNDNWDWDYPGSWGLCYEFTDHYGHNFPGDIPTPTWPTDPGWDTVKVDHATQEYCCGCSTANVQQGVLMKRHTLQVYLGCAKQE